MPVTPFEDAVDFVYSALVADTATGQPIAALANEGVIKVVRNEPGSAYEKWVGVFFAGGRYNDGLFEVNVRVQIWANEAMIGATVSPLARFTKAVQAAVLRMIAVNENDNRAVSIGDIDFPVEPYEMDKNQNTYRASITVPVTVGGGI